MSASDNKTGASIGQEQIAHVCEIHKAIPGYPGYTITLLGVVTSLAGSQPKRPRPAFVVPHQVHKAGYRHVSIRHNGTYKMTAIHRLLLLAFRGQPEPHQTCVRHLDGNPANNSLDNLAWGTPDENDKDKDRHGTRQSGAEFGMKIKEGMRRAGAVGEAHSLKIKAGQSRGLSEGETIGDKIVRGRGQLRKKRPGQGGEGEVQS